MNLIDGPSLLNGPGLLKWLKENVGSSEHVRIAVAFWGKGAAEQLVLGKNGQTTKIVCNLRMGGTNPREIETFWRKTGVEVRHSDTLHAEIYLLDKGGVVGSSNVSANGLSFQGNECSGWTEANVVFDSNSLYEATESKFNEIWKSSEKVEEQDLKDAYDAWSRKRRHLPIPNGPGVKNRTLLDVLKNDPARLADRRIYVVVWRYDLTLEAQEALTREQNQRERIKAGEGHNIDAFEDWPELPNDADLLSFYRGPRGGVEFSGFWNIPEGRRPVQLENGNTIHFCDRRNDVKGIYNPGPVQEWRTLLRKIPDSKFWDAETSRALAEFGDFARQFFRWNG